MAVPDVHQTILVHVTGRDRPGLTAGLLGILDEDGVAVYDMEQLVVRERLTLDVLIAVPAGSDVLKDLLFFAWEQGVQAEFEVVDAQPSPRARRRHVVTVMAPELSPKALQAVAAAIASAGGNIDRIVRIARYPVVAYELEVVDTDGDTLREALVAASTDQGIDVAVQAANLERRAKRLVVMDVDSTLIQGEVIELLAAEAGCLAEVAEVTERAMQGELDFEASLHARVALLTGLEAAALDRVARSVRLTPGARTFVRTLRRLGYRTAIVSGGFTHITDRLKDELGLDHAFANQLEIVDGRLTGRVVGPVVDRARKAELLREVARIEGVPLEQTVAVGDGANDLDMLGAAGLGIAFNAKPVVRDAADTAVSVPFLDAILFVLGVRRDDVEVADGDDADLGASEVVEVVGTPPL